MLTNKNKRFYLWSIGLLVVLNISTIFIVWVYISGLSEHPKHRRSHNDRIVEFVKKELSLSASQTRLYKKMRASHFQKVDSVLANIQQTKSVLMNNIFQEDSDSTQIDSLSESIGMNRARIEELTVYHFRKLEQICTPGQKKKLRNLLEKFFLHKESGASRHTGSK